MLHLELKEQGRVIAALRNLRVPDTKTKKRAWWHRPTKPRYSNTEIQAILRISEKEFEEANDAYVHISFWSATAFATKVIDWALKNGRWPRPSEYRTKNNLPGVLPTIRRGWGDEQRWGSRGRESGWNGRGNRTMEEYIIDNAKHFRRLTPELIMGIRAVHTRREAMEKYGYEKLLKKAGKLIQQDDYGKLWEMAADNDTDNRSVFVEVVNSSPEPDGSFAHYFLRVPPDTDTAKDAVEWTFEDIEKLGIELNVLVAT